MKLYMMLVIETGPTMSAADYERARDDIRDYAASSLTVAGAKLVGVQTRGLDKPPATAKKRGRRG